MNDLPKESGGSLTKGIWFVFRDNENTIIACGSVFSGKEYVYTNGELLSEKRSMKKRSEHYFKIDQTDYKAVFDVQNILTGRMICTLFRGNEIVKELLARSQFHPRRLILELFIAIILGALVGGIIGFFDLPLYWLALCIPLLLIIFWLIPFKKPFASFEIQELNA